jgi:aspartate/methionine/tyrosine aminotransferase
MKIETFDLERYQSLWENEVEYNLTESGIHPFTLRELLDGKQIDALLDIRLGYGQTNGSKELRDAVARLYPGTDRDNVLITSGSAEANFIAMWSILEPGDELILMLPNYMQIWGIARSFGVTVKPFYLRRENHWAPDLNELRDLISPSTKVIAVCNPNNPTGAVMSREAMDGMAKLAAENGILVYADEVYKGAELDGREGPSFMDIHDRTVVAAGLSKALSHPGLRIGWLVGPKDIIDQAWHRHDYTSISTSVLSQAVGTIILEPAMRQRIFDRNRALLNRNLEVIEKWVNKHGNRLSFIPPKAGGFAFVKYTMDINSTALADKLRDEKSTLIVAGDCFGMDGYIRIGIGSETDFLVDGLKRVDEALDEIR